MKRILVLVLILPLSGWAQQVEGLLLDSADQLPIPFAHIINLSRTAGHVTDQQGRFRFDNLSPEDQYKISCIGYESRYVTGREIADSPTFYLKRQARVLQAVTVKDEGADGLDMIKKAYRKYKKLPSTKSTVFKGYYEEEVVDRKNAHTLQAVLVLTGFDNQLKASPFNFMDQPEKIVLLAKKERKAVDEPHYLNGMRWVTRMSQVKNRLGHRSRWEDVVIDSVTKDGAKLNYWLTVNAKGGYIDSRMLITEDFDILMIEGLDAFCSKVVFDPEVSLTYPIYSYCYTPARDYQDRFIPECAYKMLFLEELESFDYKDEQCMGGKKMYSKQNLSIWEEAPHEPDFDWDSFEAITFPD